MTIAAVAITDPFEDVCNIATHIEDVLPDDVRRRAEGKLDSAAASGAGAISTPVRASWNVQIGIGSEIQRLDKIEHGRGGKRQRQNIPGCDQHGDNFWASGWYGFLRS